MIKGTTLILKYSVVNFPFLDGDVRDVPCFLSYGVYISQLIRFARACSHVLMLVPSTIETIF